jgi:TldD protein
MFFHEIFGHRVEANRQRNADDGQTFASRVGNRSSVVPERRVRSDAAEVGVELRATTYDDEGVKGRRVTVVDKGLEDLPARPRRFDFSRSNGHGRAEPGYVPVSRQSIWWSSRVAACRAID